MRINPIASFFKALGMALVSGVLFFFVGNFLGIVALLIYQTVTHKTLDFSNAYKYVGMPFAFAAMAIAFVYFMGLEVRKMAKS